MRLSLKELLSAGYLHSGNLDRLKNKALTGVSTDSRRMKAGEVFFALRGGTYNGHDFVEKAFESGAACAVIDEKADRSAYRDRPYLIVKDTTRAFGDLAAICRKKFSGPVIAVAGSNGKTTVKEMTARVLRTKYKVHSTPGNLNNHIGVPRTIFGLKKSHEMLLLELGTNHFGEMEYLCSIARPTHGLITNIGREHLEFFGDLAGVARAEGELFDFLGHSGTGFVNADDSAVVAMAKKVGKRMTYGSSKRGVNLYGKYISIGVNGCVTFQAVPRGKKPFLVDLSVPGSHAMSDALAAAAVGVFFKVPAKDIRCALNKFPGIGKRMEVIKAGGVTIINDTYNANPDSVLSAVRTMSSMKKTGRRIVILADMLEMGASAQEEHRRVGAAIASAEIDCLLTYGPSARWIHESADIGTKLHYDQKNMLAEHALELISPGDIVLVKGSRGMKMEDVVLFLQKRLEGK